MAKNPFQFDGLSSENLGDVEPSGQDKFAAEGAISNSTGKMEEVKMKSEDIDEDTDGCDLGDSVRFSMDKWKQEYKSNTISMRDRTDAKELKITSKFIIDPEFRDALSYSDDESLLSLENAIAEEGIREPLVVWQEEEGQLPILLDGHKRYEIAEKLNIDCRIINCPSYINTRDQAHVWIIENQSSRRNLTRFQIKYLSGKMLDKIKKNPLDNLLKGTGKTPMCKTCTSAVSNSGDSTATSSACINCTSKAPHSAEIVAELFHISIRTVQNNLDFYLRVNVIAEANIDENAKTNILNGKKKLDEYEALLKKQENHKRDRNNRHKIRCSKAAEKIITAAKKGKKKKFYSKTPGAILAVAIEGFSMHIAKNTQKASCDKQNKEKLLTEISHLRSVLAELEGSILNEKPIVDNINIDSQPNELPDDDRNDDDDLV